MKKKKIIFTCFSLVLTGVWIASGCSPSVQNPPPTLLQFPTLSALTETLVFESTSWTPTTTGTQTLIPSSTFTPAPTDTPEPVTYTPSPTEFDAFGATENALLALTPSITPHTTKTPSITPTYSPITLTPVDWACKVISSDPNRYNAFTKGDEFDGHFEVQNTGGQIWDVGKMRYRFIRGTALHKYGSSFAIPQNVAVNDKLDVIIDMKAPTDPGKYISVWSLEHSQDAAPLCLITFSITVLDRY